MEIAIFVSHFPSVSQTFVLQHVLDLIKRGHSVDIYASKAEKTDILHSDIIKYRLLEHTVYMPVIPNNFLVRVFKGLLLFFRYFKECPTLLLDSLNIFKYGQNSLSLKFIYWIIPFVKERRPYDIIHCHFGPNGLKAMSLRKLGAIQGKLIVTFHGYDIGRVVKQKGAQYYQELWKEGDLFLPISQYMEDRMVRLGCPSSKILIHHMGINLQELKSERNQYVYKETLKVISVCRLVPKKGIQYAIEAVAAVKSKRPDLKFHYEIIGDGPLKTFLERKVRAYKLENHVSFLGFKGRLEVFDLMKSTAILIAPSVTAENGDQEGIPVVLMEAMSMKIPVISTFHSGIPELVKDGASGFLVKEKDVKALSKQLEVLLNDEELRHEMGKKGRQIVKKNYNLGKLDEELIGIYETLSNS